MFVASCHEVIGGTEEWTYDDTAAMCGEFDILYFVFHYVRVL